MSQIINPNSNVASVDEQQQMQAFKRILKISADMSCEKCGCLNFVQVCRIKKVSGLASGTGRDMVIPISVYACAKCQDVPEYFLSKLTDADELTGQE